VAWEWQVRRCFDDVRETIEDKGWKYVFVEHDNDGAMPLLAESNNLCIAFFERGPGTGECWFEVRDKVRRRVMFVRDAQNIPTPERAAKLLEHHGVSSYEMSAPHKRPLYSLPVMPVLVEVE